MSANKGQEVSVVRCNSVLSKRRGGSPSMAGSYEQVVGWAYRLLQLSTPIAPVSKGINRPSER
jgi:hypothetical protein